MRKICISQRCLKSFFAIILTCISFLVPGQVSAQQNITGTVRDAAGIPLAGATITVKGTPRTTTSDVNGAFSISVPDRNSVLVISYVGHVPQEITVGDNSSLEISMQPSSGELNTVVVVGYGTQNKRDVTGSVKSLKSEAFNKGIITNPQQL